MAITKVSRNLLGTGVVNNTDGGIIVSTDGYGRALLLPANENGTAEDNLHYIGSSSYRWRDIYLSGAAYIGGTAAANALNDYEEGTWTPAYSSGTGSYTSVPYAGDSRVGRYTKIGQMVYISGKIQTSASGVVHGTAGSALQIGGLPFAASSISNFTNPGIVVTYSAFFGSSKVPFAGDCIGSVIRLRHRATGTSNAEDSSATDLATSTGGTYNRLIFFGSYITDS